MREIKFRAWDITLNKWLNPDEVRISISGKLEVRSTGSLIDFSRYIELMQYTGLKDSNGKEIYEGDIVKDYNGNVLQVSWAYCWARYMMSYDGESCQYYLEDYNKNKPDYLSMNMEVIGNIYENPDLLEVERE